MRILYCESKGCLLKPKKMARSIQSGAGGVVQENTSKLIPLRNLRSSTSKVTAKKHATKKSKSKPVQTGKGRRTRRAKVSVISSANLKPYKRACAGKKSKTIKKRSGKKVRK